MKTTLSHSPPTAAHTLTRLTLSSPQHTHLDSTEKKKERKGKERIGETARSEGRKEGAIHTKPPREERERATPCHCRPGARHSCPVTSPPAASSSLPSRRHQRPEPRDAFERGDERERRDEKGQPPRLVSVTAELQLPPCQVAVAIVEREERARRERNRTCERSHRE
ncbi:uncharacterized protein DS421_15g519180 [Arachis hypogaea]|nr:uncharacterized protein DS421_15g519180 [Arachis hypogaea]